MACLACGHSSHVHCLLALVLRPGCSRPLDARPYPHPHPRPHPLLPALNPRPHPCPYLLIPLQSRLISYDRAASTAYLSTRAPVHGPLYAVVRQACVRSLSCEFAPGKEGPVLFGDEQAGYTLSYMFQVKDTQVGAPLRARARVMP